VAGGGIGVGAALIVLVGLAEAAWLITGSGSTILQHSLHRLFGAG
jgi:hypothetical protein